MDFSAEWTIVLIIVSVLAGVLAGIFGRRKKTTIETYSLEILDRDGKAILGPFTLEHLYYLAKFAGYHIDAGRDIRYHGLNITVRIRQANSNNNDAYDIFL